MKRFFLLCFVVFLGAAACNRVHEPEGEVAGKTINLTVNTVAPPFVEENGSKVVINADGDFEWTGTENASILVGRNAVTTSKGAGQQISLSSAGKGVFSGEVTLGSSFNTGDIQAIVIPHEAGAYFRYKNSENRIIIPVAEQQTQQREGEFNLLYCPFFARFNYDDFSIDGEDTYTVDSAKLSSAADVLCFNIYGGVASGEKVSSLTLAASDRINGTCEWKIDNTVFNSNGGSSTTVTLTEPFSLDGRTRENGGKVYMGVILGGKRTMQKITVTTDRSVYTKTISYALPQKAVNRTTHFFRFALDLSTFERTPLDGITILELAPDSPRAAIGLSLADLSGFTLTMNGETVNPERDTDGNYYLDEIGLKNIQATIEWPDATLAFGDSSSADARIPYSQFKSTIGTKMGNYPLYAQVDGEVGDKLYFRDAFAAVSFNISGSGSVKSVRLSSPDGRTLAAGGLDFVVQNCLDSSGAGTALPARVALPVTPGTFPGGLDVVICGKDNKRISRHLGITSLSPGQVEEVDIAYTPSLQMVYYEGFDNFVWGADPAGVRQGYAPDATDPGIGGRTVETGFEDSETEVAAGVAGTGFFTGNTWNSGYTMTKSHIQTTSWVNSRDVWGWKYMFRVQEYQGCISVGTGNAARGWVDTPVLSALTEKSSIKLSFRLISKPSAVADVELTVLGAGKILEVKRDGASIYSSPGGAAAYTLSSKTVEGSWHTVEYEIADATSATHFQIRGSNTTGGVHGWWMDDILVTRTDIATKTAGDICDIGADLATVEYSFKLQIDPSATEGVTLRLPTGGMISGMKVDGTAVGDDTFGKLRWPMASSYVIKPGSIPDGQHSIAFTVETADAGTTFATSGPHDADGLPLYTISDESVTVTDRQRRGSLRVMYWNIQNGMWSDQAASYANFRKWIQRYDPDICVWCEAESIYKNGSSSSASTADRYFPNGWSAFASTYGHSYVANGGNRDNYSQEITSKYPITTVKRITDTDVSGKPVQHGAGHFQVAVGGRTLNFVTLHTWPQSYAPGVAEADRAASTAASEGNYYREFEMDYVVKQTINNAAYSSQSDWVLLGDFNSRSRKDNWYYNYAETSTALLCQDVVLNNTDLVDAVWQWYDGGFVPTLYTHLTRIDYVYLSPGLYSAVKDIRVVTDSWTWHNPSGVATFQNPSDHKPIIIDMDL